MKNPVDQTPEEEEKTEAVLIENLQLALLECWDELSRDEENFYNSEITLGIGRTKLSDGRIGEYQLTLQVRTEKFVEDEDRVEGYLID